MKFEFMSNDDDLNKILELLDKAFNNYIWTNDDVHVTASETHIRIFGDDRRKVDIDKVRELLSRHASFFNEEERPGSGFIELEYKTKKRMDSDNLNQALKALGY